MKFKEIARAWLDNHRLYVKEASTATYTIILTNHVTPWYGEMETVTEEDAQNFVNKKLSDGLSVSFVKDMVIVIKMVLRYGAKKGWCDAPMDWKLIYPPRQKNHQRLDAWELADQRKMIKYLREHFDFRNFSLLVAMETGMRIGEISGLRWGDFSMDTKTVRVQRTVERISCYDADGNRNGTKITIGSTKTINSNREIPLSKDIITIVRPLLKICNADYYVASNAAAPWEPRGLRVYFGKLCDKVGVPKIKFHGLRHTFATSLIAAKCDIKTVSSILGHADISTTLNLYVHPNKEQQLCAINAMLKRIGK